MDQHDLSQRNRRRQALLQADDDNLVFTFANDRERQTTINALRVAAEKFTDCAAIVAAELSIEERNTPGPWDRIVEQFKLQTVQAKCIANRLEQQDECNDDDITLSSLVPAGLLRRLGVTYSCGQRACADCYRHGPHIATDD